MIQEHLNSTKNNQYCSCCGETVQYGVNTDFDYESNLVICSVCKTPLN